MPSCANVWRFIPPTPQYYFCPTLRYSWQCQTLDPCRIQECLILHTVHLPTSHPACSDVTVSAIFASRYTLRHLIKHPLFSMNKCMHSASFYTHIVCVWGGGSERELTYCSDKKTSNVLDTFIAALLVQ